MPRHQNAPASPPKKQSSPKCHRKIWPNCPQMRQLAHPKNQSSPKCHRKIRSNCPQNALASPPKKQSSPKCHREPQQIARRAQNERQNERQNDVYACIVSRRSAIIYALFVRLCVLLRCVDDASFDGKESKDHR